MKDQIIEYLNDKSRLDVRNTNDNRLTETYNAECEAVATYAESLADKQSVEFGEWLRERAKSDNSSSSSSSSFGAFITGIHTTAQLFEIFKKERDEKHT